MVRRRNASSPPAEAWFPRKLSCLFRPSRYKVVYGGRASAKSWSFARALLILAAKKRLRILCARELQVSIRESVHELLKTQIDRLGLGANYEVLQSEVRGFNGSEFIFAGLRDNVTKIKSLEGIDIAWVEEAEAVSENSWKVLIPTIRKAGSEIWVSFNPDQESDPTYKRFITNQPPDCASVHITWKDNPWLSDESRREKDWAYATDADGADHVWGGMPRTRSKVQVLHGKWVIEPFEPQDDWDGPYQGVDWGFSQDPAVMVRLWVHAAELFVEYEAHGVGVDNDELPILFNSVPGSRRYTSRADNSRPETIRHLQTHGYPLMTAAKKWSGSVEDGVAHLRSYRRIVIHPRCKQFASEARLYSYKTDKLTGDVLPIIIDKNNHCIDAARYALAPLIKQQTLTIDPGAVPQLDQSNPWAL